MNRADKFVCLQLFKLLPPQILDEVFSLLSISSLGPSLTTTITDTWPSLPIEHIVYMPICISSFTKPHSELSLWS